MANPKVPTPHIAALEGEIAETVLLPGDPLRAKFIADNFLTDVKQFNATRNMLATTMENGSLLWEPVWDVLRSASILTS